MGLGFFSSSTAAATTATDDGAGAGIIRLLTETADALHIGDGTLSDEQAALLAEFGEKATRGRDIWVRRDGLTNPLAQPPNATDLEAAGRADNIRRYTARTLNNLHRDKCRNETILPYNSATGKEWVTTSRAWVRSYGTHVSKYRWCRGGSDGEVPDLQQVMMLRSEKPRPQRAVTIVTQLSLERTSMLEQQCAHWPHPISAVVYIPLVRGKIFSAEDDDWMLAPLEKGVDAMRAFYERMRTSQCILDMEVVAEERCSNDAATLYPANAVRNRALLMAQSDVVLLLDVDFVVDLSLVRALEDDAENAELAAALEQGKALVLPAFEAWDQSDWGKKVALDAVKEGKQYIAQKFMYNVVMGFHMSHYPQGHEKTDFWRWINSTEAYEVDYQIGFEPYILMARKYVPYYDERFRGYYWNKVQHLMHINIQNQFTYVIHPHSFVVHVPHRKPTTKWRTKRSGQKERNHVMFLEALDDMKKDRFVPVTGFPHLCLPPEIQERVASVVGNEEQKAALLSMAKAVAPLESERWEAELGSTTLATPVLQGGELPKAERPVIAAAVESQAKAKQAKAELTAAEMKADLEELRAAKARAEADRLVPEDAKLAAERAAAEEEALAAKEVMQSLEAANEGASSSEAAEEDGNASSSSSEGAAASPARPKGKMPATPAAPIDEEQPAAVEGQVAKVQTVPEPKHTAPVAKATSEAVTTSGAGGAQKATAAGAGALVNDDWAKPANDADKKTQMASTMGHGSATEQVLGSKAVRQ